MAAVLLALAQSDRLSPLDALRGPQRAPSGSGIPGRLVLAGAVLAAGAGVLLGWLGSTRLPVSRDLQRLGPVLVGVTIALGLVGCVLALPLATQGVLAGLARWFRGWTSPEALFALLQLTRRPARTNLTVGLFFMASAAAVVFSQSLGNTLADLQRWYQRTIVADFLIRGTQPDGGFLLTAPLPEGVEADLAALPGLARVERIRFLSARGNGQAVLLLARTFSSDAELPLDLRTGRPAEVRQRLAAGEAVIGTALARRLGLEVGGQLTLTSSTGSRQVRIAATVTEYAAGGQAIYLEWEAARQHFPFEGVHLFLVSLDPNANAADQDRLQQFCAERGLLVQSNADLRRFIERLLGRVQVLLWVLMTLAFLIAALGILNTLAMNLLDQAPEFAILRALGMTWGQVRCSLLWQGGLLVTFGAWPAVVVGTGLACLLNQASSRLFGHEVAFQVQPTGMLGALGLAYLVGLLVARLTALPLSTTGLRRETA
jgi:putative ABC transport system permease protein